MEDTLIKYDEIYGISCGLRDFFRPSVYGGDIMHVARAWKTYIFIFTGIMRCIIISGSLFIFLI